MRVRINRNVCVAHLAVCERCFGRFLLHPEGYDRHCFEVYEDDGREELTLEMVTNGHEIKMVLDEDARRMIAGDGWTNFVDFDVPMYRNAS